MLLYEGECLMSEKISFEYIRENEIFVAHRRLSDGVIQPLWEHLLEAAEISGDFAGKIGLQRQGELVGLLHDIGKGSQAFNRYICSATGLLDPDADDYMETPDNKGKIDHSSAGAQLVWRSFVDGSLELEYAREILAIIIASHHSGLIDCLTIDGRDDLSRRMHKDDMKTRLMEAEKNIPQYIKVKLIELLSDKDILIQLTEKIRALRDEKDNSETLQIKIGLLTRYLFSCLIDADRMSTADFEYPSRIKLKNNGRYTEWEYLLERLNEEIEKFSDINCSSEQQKNVNEIRQFISEQCWQFSKKEKGIYQLTVPTGGGKTLASLRFALNHAKEHKMERIVYVIPYTSIIDQNADVARRILENKEEGGEYVGNVVLEHHSNLTPEEETGRQKILAENWDAPIVFTTMVQFLETMFGHGTRNARRMHQLANAVVIFDEIQTLPVKCVHLFNCALRFMIKGCGSTAVLCTATQPLLDKVIPRQRAITIEPEKQIIQDALRLFEKLKRVEVFDRCNLVGWEEEKIIDLITCELLHTDSVLIITNTKKAAANLFTRIKGEPSVEIFHLSTGMCPVHRMNVITEIRKRLEDRRPTICISTQLIEAGIDVDFGSVIRYLAGLDSIAQAAGRCNRNGARSQLGRVFIINPVEENLDRLPDIWKGRAVTKRILNEFKTDPEQFDCDLIGPKAIERYYEYYFYDRAGEMSYSITSKSFIGRTDTVFNLLATNQISVEAYRRANNNTSPRIALRQAFMSAAKIFQSIDSATIGIIVPYEKGREIIEELCADSTRENKFSLLKQAQRYSINIFSHIFAQLTEEGVIREIQRGEGIYYLDERYYSLDYGMSEVATESMKFLNC